MLCLFLGSCKPQPTESDGAATTTKTTITTTKPKEDYSAYSSLSTLEVIAGNPDFQMGKYYDGPIAEFRKPNDKVTLGVWWWDARLLKSRLGNAKSVDRTMDFLLQNNVTEIYLCIDGMTSEETGKAVHSNDSGKVVTEEEVRVFIKRCTTLGIRVEALIGNQGSWILPEDTEFEQYMELLKGYQSRAGENEKFSAIHLDCEPYIKYNLDAGSKYLDDYVNFFLKEVRPAADQLNLPLVWDIPSWYNQTVTDPKTGDQMPLGELKFKYCDAVGIMSYKDSAYAMYGLCREEFLWAKKYNKKLHLGAECYYLKDGDSVSFAEEGRLYMHEQFKKLRQLIDDKLDLEQVGLSVHYAHTWLTLNDEPQK